MVRDWSCNHLKIENEYIVRIHYPRSSFKFMTGLGIKLNW